MNQGKREGRKNTADQSLHLTATGRAKTVKKAYGKVTS